MDGRARGVDGTRHAEPLLLLKAPRLAADAPNAPSLHRSMLQATVARLTTCRPSRY
jgi:hypothetical protein